MYFYAHVHALHVIQFLHHLNHSAFQFYDRAHVHAHGHDHDHDRDHGYEVHVIKEPAKIIPIITLKQKPIIATIIIINPSS